MSDPEPKKRSGCKIAGCGCLILLLIIGMAGGIGVFFVLRAASPGEIEAEHFLPEGGSGTMVLSLHSDDEGLNDMYGLILETLVQQDESSVDEIPDFLKEFIPGLGGTSVSTGPIGPRILVSFPKDMQLEAPYPLAIVDLSSYSKVAATAIQIAMKTTLATTGNQSSYRGFDIYGHEVGGYAWSLYKGFVVASDNPEAVQGALDALEENRAREWPEVIDIAATSDLAVNWSGNFSQLAKMGGTLLDIAPPKDGDFEKPVSDISQARLTLDVKSRDKLTFSVIGDAVSLDAVRRVEADLVEHANEIQGNLEETPLRFTFISRTENQRAILDGELTGLQEYLIGVISGMTETVAMEPVETN